MTSEKHSNFKQSNFHFSALMRAAATGNVNSVRALIEEGADVNQLGPRNSTALMFAAGGGHLEIVRELVESGADVFAKEEGGWMAICHAREDEDEEVIEYLQRVMDGRAVGGVRRKVSARSGSFRRAAY